MSIKSNIAKMLGGSSCILDGELATITRTRIDEVSGMMFLIHEFNGNNTWIRWNGSIFLKDSSGTLVDFKIL